MKYRVSLDTLCNVQSPSMRREWIEILFHILRCYAAKSPSMRREWIEMIRCASPVEIHSVSLHAEGVD